ncbi:uncharacterized protein TNCV_457211 [Trichonephila clavipes]|nr:uncharacterized protein TNCV_457211 [Trichonephila clavipes]
MTYLHDKLESYLRALETLGVTTEKWDSILYPMVESCFPEDFLKAWNRSATSAASTDAKERLTNLMTFLKAETEGEDRINLAMTGFGLGVDEIRQSFKNKVRYFPKEEIPTAANLLTTASKEVKKKCVFCTGKHSSRDCFQTQKMSLAERHNILREKQCCFACLTPKHTARSCKTYLRCVICGKKHVPLMCESLTAKNQDSYRRENKGPKVEVNMANNTSSTRVFLQTLKIKMVCGNKEIPKVSDKVPYRFVTTGQRRILSCGLVAMETILGWTLSGKVPDSEISSCNAMLVASLFVKEMDISQLWRLDSLGIQDPSEQKTKEELHKASMEHFLRTVKVDEEERFLVFLP